MLELRPSCEHCEKSLPPESTEARICSFECTFCQDCVTHVLNNVCPNCGGGFQIRPVRPQGNHRNNNNLEHYPPGTRVVFKPVKPETFEPLRAKLQHIPPELR